MEVICDDYLQIYWLNFGAPGARNDLQIMNQSKFFNDIRTGQWPPVCPEIDICGFSLRWFYLLSDGIYPAVRYLMSSISCPRTLKEKLYAKKQEGARKAVERVFGVLFLAFQNYISPFSTLAC
jgi:Plant transposon protein